MQKMDDDSMSFEADLRRLSQTPIDDMGDSAKEFTRNTMFTLNETNDSQHLHDAI